MLAADPLQERVHRALMELYSRQGRHAAALRQYRSCAELLAKELSIEPDATTKQLRRDILRQWNRIEAGTSSDVHSDPVETVSEIKVESNVTSSLEQRQLTVLVCGLANMGTLAKQLDPEELQELNAAYKHCCSQIISQSGGTVTMLPGGETLVYFGYPQAHEYDAERAVRVGLSLVEAIAKLDVGRVGPMQLSVGITTGPVLCDPIANGANRHALVGEVIQQAISLLQLSEPNTVVISMTTRRLIGDLFDYEDHGLVALKGFSEPIPVWRVLGARAVDSRFEALRTSRGVLVGRVDELDLLVRRWQKAKGGEGAVVLVSGEPGIGKSCRSEFMLNHTLACRMFAHRMTKTLPFIHSWPG
jgi:class 3 adenylate cyclase